MTSREALDALLKKAGGVYRVCDALGVTLRTVERWRSAGEVTRARDLVRLADLAGIAVDPRVRAASGADS